MIPEGSLSEFSLPDLLQIISMEAGTGTLTLTAPGRQGKLEAASGDIVAAACGPKLGEEAVYALFLWEAGDFGWVGGSEGHGARNVALGLDHLTREGIERRDKWSAAKQALPSLNAVFRRKDGATAGQWGDVSQRAFEALTDGHKIGDLGRKLELSPAAIASALIPLWADGVLDAEIPPTEAAWGIFRKLMAEFYRRFADISGLRMTEGFETFLRDRAVARGIEVAIAGHKLRDGEPPQGDPVQACGAMLSEVKEYVSRLHGSSFVERVVAEVSRSASLPEQAALERLDQVIPAQASLPGDGQ